MKIKIVFIATMVLSVAWDAMAMLNGIDTLHSNMFDFSCPKQDCGESTSIDIVYYPDGNFITRSITGAIKDMGISSYSACSVSREYPADFDLASMYKVDLPKDMNELRKHVYIVFTRAVLYWKK
jgi:hypothetical protein